MSISMRYIVFFAFLCTLLSACVTSPVQYESSPIILDTPQGKVNCQLYTRELVVWDRSIGRPDKMSVAAADNYCINEGKREQRHS